MTALWSAAAASSRVRRPNEAGRGALAPHFRLLELGGGNRAVESGAQFLGCLQRQLNPGPRPGFEVGVDEVERDDVAQRRMAGVVIGNHRLREREPFVPAFCHALCTCDLNNGRAHVRGLLLRQMVAEEGEHLAPAIHCLLGAEAPDMCTSNIEIARAEGMAKCGDEWFP